ncbi:hypothetical protein [Streptomyces sp. V4I2]|nr:hypothetical protein [Streptomyces sp. V4I2]
MLELPEAREKKVREEVAQLRVQAALAAAGDALEQRAAVRVIT